MRLADPTLCSRFLPPAHWVPAVAAVVLALACNGLTLPPDDYVLPPPDESLDPTALRPGGLLFACGDWVPPGPPDSAWVLADLFFRVRSEIAPFEAPEPESLERVQALGGRVLFRFAFPAARVRITPAAIPLLAWRGDLDHARTVPDARRYDWQVLVEFTRPLQSADSLDFVSLGGRVRIVASSVSGIYGELPNQSVIALRARSDVLRVRGESHVCVEPE